MPRERDLKDLAAISRYAGRDLLLVQGPGGNTSVKTGEGSRLLIKASGFRVAGVTESEGFIDLDLAALRRIFEEPALADLPPVAAHDRTVEQVRALVTDPGSPRPSMETGFHVLLERVVLHTHPVYLNAFACSEGGREAFREAGGGEVAWVPYATPGYPLAALVAAQCARHRADHGRLPRRIVLQNHGLITTAPTAGEAIDDTRALVSRGERVFGSIAGSALEGAAPSSRVARWAEALAAALAERGSGATVRPARYRALLAAAREPGAVSAGPLVPDDAVYGVHNLQQLDPGRPPQDWLDEQGGRAPAKAVLVLEGEGILLIGPNPRTLDYMEENLLANVLIHRLIRQRGKARHLSAAAVDELLALESEQYRQALARRHREEGTRCRS